MYILSDDLTTPRLYYNDFSIHAIMATAPVNTTETCQVNLAVLPPKGWQFSVVQVDYRGYANLPDGIFNGTCITVHSFFGSPEVRIARFIGQDRCALLNIKQITSSVVIQGPFDANFLKTTVFSAENTIWSTCNNAVSFEVVSTNEISPIFSDQTAKLGACSHLQNMCII